MVIFNSYVKLPEGTLPYIQTATGFFPLLEATQIDEDPRDAVVCDRLVIKHIQRPDVDRWSFDWSVDSSGGKFHET